MEAKPVSRAEILTNKDARCTFTAIVEFACPTCAALDGKVVAIGSAEWAAFERMEHGCERPSGDPDDPCGCGCNLIYAWEEPPS